jgi:hypothetical protein
MANLLATRVRSCRAIVNDHRHGHTGDVTGHQLSVDCRAESDAWTCHVVVGDDDLATRHEVRVEHDDLTSLDPGSDQPAALVEESFRFMLEREPREAILRRFALPVIGRYFPEYEREIRRRLAGAR